MGNIGEPYLVKSCLNEVMQIDGVYSCNIPKNIQIQEQLNWEWREKIKCK